MVTHPLVQWRSVVEAARAGTLGTSELATCVVALADALQPPPSTGLEPMRLVSLRLGPTHVVNARLGAEALGRAADAAGEPRLGALRDAADTLTALADAFGVSGTAPR